MHNQANSSGSVFSASDWLNNHFSIKSHGRYSYVESLPIRPGERVLDLGCANGSWSRLIAERVGAAGRVLAVDHDPVLINQASNSIADTHLSNRLEFSIMEIPSDLKDLEGNFTLITAFNVVSLLPDATSLLQAVRELLTPQGGLLILKDSAISTDFYWPITSELAYEIQKRLAGGGRVNGYDPNFALRCRGLLSQCGFSVNNTLLHSYAFLHPFSTEQRRYISGNASIIAEIDSPIPLSGELERWTSATLSECGPFFDDPNAIYTTTEFTYVCSIM